MRENKSTAKKLNSNLSRTIYLRRFIKNAYANHLHIKLTTSYKTNDHMDLKVLHQRS